MKNLNQLIVGGLTLLGVGAIAYRAYNLKKLSDVQKNDNVIEIEVETKDESRK